MIAKIVKGAGAKGIVDYILDRKKGASLIDHDGVLVSDNGSIARSFIAQSRFNPKVGKFIGHISLSFSEQDLPHLTDELMVRISREYMMKMGICDTQYIIGRHHDKEHPHVHIAFNRIDNNGRTISDRNDLPQRTRLQGAYPQVRAVLRGGQGAGEHGPTERTRQDEIRTVFSS